MNYKDLKLKCGLEIHFQLDTKHKLFCNCLTTQSEKNPIAIIERKQHPVPSELGEIDVASQFEYLRDRTFFYQVFEKESCLVESDSEPPHSINKEALEMAIKVGLILNCRIVDEIYVMRKTIIDGSNTSGFQRSLIIAKDGFFEYKNNKIGINYVVLEEDSAAIVKEENGKVFYRLNRLGIPLVEISTQTLEGFDKDEIMNIAYTLGLYVKSVAKIKKGIGSIRQDINISILNKPRVEIKGIQELSLIPKVIDYEVKRMMKEEVKEETRAANPDGSTRFLRPLPGAARMYPETDIEPIEIPKKLIKKLLKELPIPLTKKLEEYKNKYNISEDLVYKISKSEYVDLIDKIISRIKVQPKIIISFFTSTLINLKRKGYQVDKIDEKKFFQIFELLEKRKIIKESLEILVEKICENLELEPKQVIEKFDLKPLTKEKVEELVKDYRKKFKDKSKLFGILMKEFRGKIDPDLLKDVLSKLS